MSSWEVNITILIKCNYTRNLDIEAGTKIERWSLMPELTRMNGVLLD